MSERIFKLSETEVAELDMLLSERKSKFIRNMLISAGVGLVLSIVPMGFLPRSGHLSAEDRSISLIESIGFGWWMLLFGLVMLVIYFALRADYKIVGLEKDFQEEEGLELDVTVVEKVGSDDHYVIFVTNDTTPKLRIFLDRIQYGQFYVGQKITIRVYRNAKVLMW